MNSLGSIYEEEDGTRPKGPDLVAEVEVPRGALGLEDGYPVEVPMVLEDADGNEVERAKDPYEEEGIVTLRLPEGFPENGALKLRGQGGVGERAGDLIVKVTLVDGELEVFGGGGELVVDPADGAAMIPWIAVAFAAVVTAVIAAAIG